jgi:N-acetylneuraminate lyase
MWQARSVEMIRRILDAGGLASQKAVMQLIGQDCGPPRLPLAPLGKDPIERLRKRLEEIGFFQWAT